MQARNRRPVQPVRPGMGRISPDRPFQNQGTYGGSGNRAFRRGGGYRRGPSKTSFPYPPPAPPLPPPPRRKEDVFMEAGRLAAEYLVAKGVLPPSSLPRWGANGGVYEFKGRDRENAGYEGRASALNRLGNSDGGSGRRRYGRGSNHTDEYDDAGSRNSLVERGRKRRGDRYSGNSNGSEWRRESARSGQWMDRSRSFSDNLSNSGSGNNAGDLNQGNFASGYRRCGFDEFEGDGREFRAVEQGEELPKNDDNTYESDTDTSDFPDDVVLKDCFSRARKAPVKEPVGGLNKEVDDAQATMNETADGKSDGRSITDTGGEVSDNSDNSTVQDSLAVVGEESEQDTNLLRSCGFAKVPTRPRTPMGSRRKKVSRTPENDEMGKKNHQTTIENGKIIDICSDAEPKLTSAKNSMDCSSTKEVNDLTNDSVYSMPEKPAILTVENTEKPNDQCPNSPTDLKGCTKSVPLTETPSLSQNQNRSSNDTAVSIFATESKDYTKLLSLPEISSIAQNPVEISRSSSFGSPIVDLDSKKEDCFPLHGVVNEGIKRPRDWSTSIELHHDDYLQMRNLRAHKSNSSCQNLIHLEEMVESIDQKKSVNSELCPKTEQGTSIQVKEDKRFVPNSFKICDLNLIEGHDITENPDDHVPEQTSGTSLTPETRNVPSVEFGLSVGLKNNSNDLHGQCSNDNKTIVIDLGDGSSAEGGTREHSKPKNEPVQSNLDNPFSQTDNTNTVNLPSIHDGYSVLVSDLLGPDLPTCPPASGEVNSLQQGMNILEQGLPGDDDSIYVSLGELSLSFMDAWDPPPQEYGKYF